MSENTDIHKREGKKQKMRVLLGMSGGLDSTYAAIKLKEKGYDVEGALLLMHDYADIESAKESAASVGIPLKIIDCKKLFCEKVIDNFAAEYLKGRTPNPCIVCNDYVKFAALYEAAKEGGFDKIATGHYAGIVRKGGRYALVRGKDEKKDQSYMLWRLKQDILSVLELPLYDSYKSEIKVKSKEIKLAAADRDESQEICFIPDNDYASYIEKNYASSPCGDFVDTDGNVLGRHKGILHYTVGQRKGLGIALGERAFVRRIESESNRIVLSRQSDVGNTQFEISDLVFSGLEKMTEGSMELLVKVRYLAPPVKAKITFNNGTAQVILFEKRVVTPGQSAVFYDGDTVMLGGFIN